MGELRHLGVTTVACGQLDQEGDLADWSVPHARRDPRRGLPAEWRRRSQASPVLAVAGAVGGDRDGRDHRKFDGYRDRRDDRGAAGHPDSRGRRRDRLGGVEAAASVARPDARRDGGGDRHRRLDGRPARKSCRRAPTSRSRRACRRRSSTSWPRWPLVWPGRSRSRGATSATSCPALRSPSRSCPRCRSSASRLRPAHGTTPSARCCSSSPTCWRSWSPG